MSHSQGEKLLQAARDGQPGTVRQLLSSGVNPDHRDADGSTALHIASENFKCPAIIDVLLLCKPRVDAKDNNNQTALMLAARRGKYFAVRKLVEHKAALDAQDVWQCNALDYAINERHTRIEQYLRSRGARPTGNTALPPVVEHRNLPEDMYLRMLDGTDVTITSTQLRYVTGNINNLRQYMCANYVVHMLKRSAHAAIEPLCDFDSHNRDYFLDLYYSANKFHISRREMRVVESMIDSAEDCALIRAGAGTHVKQSVRTNYMVRELKHGLDKLTKDVFEVYGQLSVRVARVESVSGRFATQLTRLAANDKHFEQLVTDLLHRTNELQAVRDAADSSDKFDKVVRVVRFFAAFIPVVGGPTAELVAISMELVFSYISDQRRMARVENARAIGVDPTDIGRVRAVTQYGFLRRLHRKARKAIRLVARESKFGSIEELVRCLAGPR